MRSRTILPALAALGALAVAAPPTPPNPWIEKRAPLNIAHQGGEDEFPSNTLYAFHKALRAGADMLELDIGRPRTAQVVVMHDTTVDGKTNGRGTVSSKTLKQMKRLDAAYWFAPGKADHYSHDHPASAYRFRGVATGRKRAPRGYTAADFRVPTLAEVMREFPHTPINIEIKGRTPNEATSEYIKNAELLARLLKKTHRHDLIVVSFKQQAVDRFHELAPKIDVAPGIDGFASWLTSKSRRARAWSPSRFRSPTCSAARCSRSRRRRTWPAHTARATPGTTGSGTTTATIPPPGAG